MFKKILLAVDGSKPSEAVVSWAKEACESFSNVELTFFHVKPPLMNAIPYGVGYLEYAYTIPKDELEAKEDIDSPAYKAWEKLSHCDFVSYKHAYGGGAAEQICQEIEEGNYDLVVLGSKGHGLVSTVLLGSVSAKVLHNAKCNVLVVR